MTLRFVCEYSKHAVSCGSRRPGKIRNAAARTAGGWTQATSPKIKELLIDRGLKELVMAVILQTTAL